MPPPFLPSSCAEERKRQPARLRPRPFALRSFTVALRRFAVALRRFAVALRRFAVALRENAHGGAMLGRVWVLEVFAVGWLAAVSAEARPVDFNRDIRPLLSDRCFHCHGPDPEHRQGGLRLDVEDGALGKVDGRPVVTRGDPEKSELFARIRSSDPDERMPPTDSGKELSADEIELLRRWIQAGAKWSEHWAYVPPVGTPTPAVENRSWALHWVDDFILARLEAEGLAPSPDADRVTLVRRLSYDLTGLPATPETVERFVSASSPQAFEELVERLLASTAFGERMAVYWLDLVRYADTVGYHGDQDHNISPYRDYVIRAFNNNVPFDRFTREQLAGDFLAADVGEDAGLEVKIASGYNRLLQTSHEGGVQAKEYLAIYAADRIRNLSGVWLGATLGCAQCHDHKYDPYTAKDFYAMSAFFADIDEAQHLSGGGNSIPTRRPPELFTLARQLEPRLDAAAAEVKALEAEQKRNAGDPGAEKELQERLRAAKERRRALQLAARPTMITVSIEPRVVRVLPRGNWLDDSGPIVQPEVPEFLGSIDTGGRRATRLDLARWLTTPRQSDGAGGVGGLTARVFVNRLWYLVMGEGLTRSLDDFGGQGEPPVHPELLDRLAIEFVESGWDVKRLLRLLVTTRTYRQASLVSPALAARDPENQLFARQSRFRLPAEFIRDNALAISGLLVEGLGGASVKPYQPAGYYRHLNFPQRTYQAHQDRRQWRRGVYTHWQRQYLHPMLRAFDAPSREECTARRPRSNTPLAALTLLNDPTFVETARAFAERILRDGGSSDLERLDFAFRCAVARLPAPEEREVLQQLLSANRKEYASHPEEAEVLASTGEAPPSKESERIEVAAWTGVARALLNLNETITRN